MKILVVDDDRVTVELLSEVLEANGYEVKTARSAEQAKTLLPQEEYPIVVSDIRMSGLDGLSLLTHIKQRQPKTVVVMMTAFGSVDTAVEAVKKGAFDYISKPFNVEELLELVTKAAAQYESLRSSSEAVVSSEPVHARKTLMGKSRSIVEVFKFIARAAVSDSNVLILGESGTGKELVAREIHAKSARADRPFFAVNCGALTETLLESELFGHERGAFTGAVGTKKGLLEEADRGVLFLDEIGDISHALQVKLLRVLQEGEFKPIGSNRIKKVDVRVIAATHRNLTERVKEESFREDLYFRLKVIQIQLPPLRDRLEDIHELIPYFLEQCGHKTQKRISHVSEEAMDLLLRYRWPGNIRELEHAIEHAIVMAKSSVLFPEDFPEEIQSSSPSISETSAERTTPSLEAVEKKHIQDILKKVKFNKSKAAEILGIDRATLYRKAAKYNISLDSKGDPKGSGVLKNDES